MLFRFARSLALVALTDSLICTVAHPTVVARDNHVALQRPNPKATSGPLYGKSGSPVIDDVKQHVGQDDCYVAATLCALVKGNSGWISSKIHYAGDFKDLTEASIILHDQQNLMTTQNVIVKWEDANALNDNSGSVWWPGLVLNALILTGAPWYNAATGKFSGNSASEILRRVTGFDAILEKGITQDNLWTWVQKSDFTPVLVGTKLETTVLKENHWFTVMTTDSSKQTVKLHNPMGGTKDYPLGDIVADISDVAHLVGWESFLG